MTLDTGDTGVLINLSQDLPLGATRHFFNGNDDDSAVVKEIVAAPGVGRKLILTHLTFGTFIPQSIFVLKGTGIILVGPIQLEAAGVGYVKDYKWGLELPENTSMSVDSDTDGLFHIYIEYINAPV